MDFFEIDRVIDDLAKSSAAPCATTWFKIINDKNPTKDEYRKKVIEFIKIFEEAILSNFPENQNTTILEEFLKRTLSNQISGILSGNNKEVEKRYKYYVDHT